MSTPSTPSTMYPQTMKPAHKLATVLAMPAAFVLAFLLAFAVMGAADVFAQPAAEQPAAEQPAAGEPAAAGAEPGPSGFAPPNEGPDGDDHGTEALDADAHAGHAQGEHAAAMAGTHANAAHGGAHGGGHGDPSKHFNFFDFGWKSKDAMGGQLGDGVMTDPATGATEPEEPMSAPFIFMVLNFVILVIILAKKGGPAANSMAAERHDQIKNALEEAAKLRAQAADKLAEYESRLKDADAEIARMVDGMKKDAEADKARILESAERQAAQMKKDAELRIAAEIELARATLTREVTLASAAATEKLLREKMIADDQNKLVAAFISDVQSAKSSTKERV